MINYFVLTPKTAKHLGNVVSNRLFTGVSNELAMSEMITMAWLLAETIHDDYDVAVDVAGQYADSSGEPRIILASDKTISQVTPRKP